MATLRSVLTSSVLALSLLSLAACAETPVGSAPATPSTAPSATPSADPAEAGPSVPEQVFGGDCAAVLSADEATSVLTVPVGPQASAVALLPFSQSARDVGGLNCGWESSDEAASASLRLTVLPADVGGAEATTKDNYCDALPGEGECLFSIVEQGWWFSANITPMSSDTDAVNAQIATLTSLLVTAAGSAGAAEDFVPKTVLDGEWTGGVDCVALGQTVNAEALLQVPGLVLAPEAPVGPIEAPVGYYAAGDAAGFAACTWYGSTGANGEESPGVFVYYLPGASWIESEIAALPGAEKLSGEGIDRAYLVTDPALSSDRAQVLHVFDGVNWLAITGGPLTVDESFVPFAAALVAERNAAS
jgi:hypothetical protein